ncbi:MAG: CinA family protein [Bacilli bacterium]|nr:CinA family protein [Bacilli bacterium]
MNIYEKIVEILKEKKETVSTMESCTGGSLAGTITNVEGASATFQYGAVTYSNDFKIKMGVSKEVIDTYTVYSMETAKEMAKAISAYSDSAYGIGITGKLGKEDPMNLGGSNEMVYISIFDKEKDFYICQTFTAGAPSREECKKQIIHLIGIIFFKYINKK